MKKLLKKENVFVLIFVLVALHPFIELDYLFYDVLNAYGLPRLTTIVNFIILPLLVLGAFYLFDAHKKRTLVLFLVYCLFFGLYFLLHCQGAIALYDNLFLTPNFAFSLTYEIIYTLTLLIPLVYIYVFQLSDIKESLLKKCCILSSLLTGVPIFVSNLFCVGFSTYQQEIFGNILSWFFVSFSKANHPRYYATKFYFEQGNTIGILLIMVLPFLYYFFLRSIKRGEKLFLGLLIFMQSLAMFMISTRIATYGAILVPACLLVIYLVLNCLKYEHFKQSFLFFTVLMIALGLFILPHCPAYQNQQLDADDYDVLFSNDHYRSAGKDSDEGTTLTKYSDEWRYYYMGRFEAYSWLIRVTPPIYYKEWYSYKHDPQFWCDLIFDYPLEARVNGRQVQNIFMHYKFDELAMKDKALGMGYSTFMNGSIILEKDFSQQLMTYGYSGFILLLCPWLFITIYLAIKLLLGYGKRKWTFLNIILLMAACIGLLSSYVSGHTLDQLTTSMFISLCLGVLAGKLRSDNVRD